MIKSALRDISTAKMVDIKTVRTAVERIRNAPANGNKPPTSKGICVVTCNGFGVTDSDDESIFRHAVDETRKKKRFIVAGFVRNVQVCFLASSPRG